MTDIQRIFPNGPEVTITAEAASEMERFGWELDAREPRLRTTTSSNQRGGVTLVGGPAEGDLNKRVAISKTVEGRLDMAVKERDGDIVCYEVDMPNNRLTDLGSWCPESFVPSLWRQNPLAISSTPVFPVPGTKADASTIARAGNKFGVRLFGEILKGEKLGKNIFVSPTSIAMALAVALSGAEGETRKAMEETLALQGFSAEDINQAYQSFQELLKKADPKVILEIANSIWVRPGVDLNSTFKETAEKAFSARVDQLRSVNQVNGWVKEKTKGKIPTILDSVDPSMALAIINAVYFKGKWKNPFDKKVTKDEPFTTASGKNVPVPMMYRKGSYKYVAQEGFQAIQLPYGEGGEVSMMVFLPNGDLDPFLQNLTADNLDRWIRSLDSQRSEKGTIQLPRFETRYGLSLNQALQALGMGNAYSHDANFSGISDVKPLFVGNVLHRAFVEVNEEGTEAAAATAVTMMRGMETLAFNMKVNRPFFFVIHDEKTGAILFTGLINDPAKKG